MHEIIEYFFDNIKKEKINLQEITEKQIIEIVEKIINEMLNNNKNYVFTSSAKYKLLVTRLKRIVTKALKYIVDTINMSKFEILGTEVEFGEKGKYKPIKLNLGNGKTVEIIGKIDRIDISKNENGSYLRIIDYKSSAKNIDLNDVYGGLQIQLITYLDAVCKEEDLLPAGILYFSLLEQMVKADKKMSDEEIEEKIRANFKMKGLILADINVIRMHDKTLTTGGSNIVPAYIDQYGNIGKKTSGITKEQFEDLQNYINKTIKEIAKEIYKGNIDLKPFNKNGKTPCAYCTYKSICGFQAGMCGNDYNYIAKLSQEEIFQKIKSKK